MAIKMTPSRRSQLVEQLLKQNAEQFAQNPQSWGETIAKMLAMGIRQGQANRMQTEESQTTKVRGANEAAALAAVLGENQTDFQGKPIMGGGQTNDLGRIIQGSQQPYGPADPGQARAHLMTQNPESPYGPALAEVALKQKMQKPEKPVTDAVNFGDRNGEPTGTYIKGSPEYFKAVNDPNQFVIGNVSQTQLTDTVSDQRSRNQLGKLQVELNDQVGAVNSFGSQADRLLKIVRETEGANTLTAALANVGNRIKNEAKSFARLSGVEFESGMDAFNANRFEEAFSAAGLAGANARVKNGYLALAIQKAIASGLGSGRALSDKDIESQLVTLGKNQSDPNIIANIFQDSFDSVSDNVRFRAEAQGLDLPEIKEFNFGANGANDPVRAYLEELRRRRESGSTTN